MDTRGNPLLAKPLTKLGARRFCFVITSYWPRSLRRDYRASQFTIRAPSTACCTASATSRRSCTCRVLLRDGFTRLVRTTTNRSFSGSIQIEVPVKPVWPKLQGEKNWPALEPPSGESQPSALVDSLPCRAVQRAIVAGLTIRTPFTPSPPLRIIMEKSARSFAVEKSPAWPATPPSAYEFSSWTVPHKRPPRASST